MREIPLTKGQVALVDDEDYEWLTALCAWQAAKPKNAKTYYANSRQGLMHRIITGAPGDSHVDHWDGNGLNNQRTNLRVCTPGENGRNSKKHAAATSRFKGVSWYKAGKAWEVAVTRDRVSYYVGRFTDEVEAALAYDRAAFQLHAEFASYNFPGNEQYRAGHPEFGRKPKTPSGLFGVKEASPGRWAASVGATKKHDATHLGTFSSPEEAAAVRDAYIIKHSLTNSLNSKRSNQ